MVLDPAALLATTTTRIAINVAQSARARRETPYGSSPPEPNDVRANPTVGLERGETLELALRMLLTRLSPSERAAYILREAFDYSYREIAEVLTIREANARQLVTRARRGLARERRTAPVSADDERRLVDAFVAAAQAGNLAHLEQLLAAHQAASANRAGALGDTRVPIAAGGYVLDIRSDRKARRGRRALSRSSRNRSARRAL
jgi:RNA polymerase sigma-70 factor (ECF subfamily)